ncbi:MAG: 1-deoxy-D-xylulose-5-phosphate synthase [Planctomycetes bacterium]|nr:1-deoxy-D-xylulose-5-phosphate synthase [Planctomycetota bacterium]
MHEFLDKINTPEDIKALRAEDLPKLASEIRQYIIDVVAGSTGGHLGSGLGTVEITLALHYYYNFLNHDSLVFDVGHQCYPHKILTGRKDRLGTLRQSKGLSGFPDPKESPFDLVKTGHGGTSLSTAIGIAMANKLCGRTDRMSVAVIGDGALQEGQALEALNHGGDLRDLKLLVVLNDNAHGIGPATGALASYFSKFRTSQAYTKARREAKRMLSSLDERGGSFGKALHDVVDHVKAGLHGLMPAPHPGVLFEELGFFYYGPIDGHNTQELLDAFENIKRPGKPVLLHVLTKKGKGFNNDADDFYAYHAASTHKKHTSHLPKEYSRHGTKAYTDIFVDETMKLMEADSKVVAITAAMLQGTGLQKVIEKYPDRCFDVGMAEQHAVGFAQGLKLGGIKPICAVYSTFLQRSVDQLFQEIALIKTPVLFCLDRAGLVGPDGATHNGVFDIAYMGMLPNMVIMAPRDATELRKMMRWGLEQKLPTSVRFPRTQAPKADTELPDNQPIEMGKAEILREGHDGVVIAFGSMVYHALDAIEEVERDHGKKLMLINARFAKPLDENLIARVIESQPVVFTVEEHVRHGGFGSTVMDFANRARLETTKIEIIALPDKFIDHGQRVEVLTEVGLHPEGIRAGIERRLGLASRASSQSGAQRPISTKSVV